jgi:hypothetical protein
MNNPCRGLNNKACQNGEPLIFREVSTDFSEFDEANCLRQAVKTLINDRSIESTVIRL